jgi:hypothetical protein
MRGSIVKRGKTYSYVLYLGRAADGRKKQKWVGGFVTCPSPPFCTSSAPESSFRSVETSSGHSTGGLTRAQEM